MAGKSFYMARFISYDGNVVDTWDDISLEKAEQVVRENAIDTLEDLAEGGASHGDGIACVQIFECRPIRVKFSGLSVELVE